MTHTQSIFHAGLTTRWHANPHLAQTCDRIDGHQARVARIILAFWPDASRNVIVYALTHDDGESVTGDIPAPAGKTSEQEWLEAKSWETVWTDLHRPDLTKREIEMLKFADKYDAYQWARHHALHVVAGQSDWCQAYIDLLEMAKRLDVEVTI